VTRVAAIDCGTNSIRLLAAEAGASGRLCELDRRLEIVRLGQGVDATGRFTDEALARTFAACERYAEVIARLRVQRVRFCATSAARDAANVAEFSAGVTACLGVSVEVLSGAEEAALSYDGATRELDPAEGVPPPHLVVDIGGGSTEFVLGDGHGRVRAAQSVDVGSVRMTERHLAGDPPGPEEIAAAARDIDATLDTLDVSLSDARTLVGVGGTVTTVAAMVLGLSTYDSARIHLARLLVSDVEDAVDRLLAMTRQRRRTLGFMHPGRADVIGAGALVLQRVLSRMVPTLGAPRLVVSEHDILDGIAWSLL
jgi:exopolyphosphatase/guanosine-5'-triphosphate,3'-diphosphate pyrophosphatase